MTEEPAGYADRPVNEPRRPRRPRGNGAAPTDSAGPPRATRGKRLDAQITDFWSHLPSAKYLFVPTRDLWPARSVNAHVPPVQINADQKVSPTTWLDRNRAITQVIWHPDHPQIIEGRAINNGGWVSHSGTRAFNLYMPPPPSVAGSATRAGPWLDHVRRLYPSEADHLISYLAFKVQNPGVKVNHALVLGGVQGIGKDSIIQPVKHAVGDWNVSDVSPTKILGRFNPWTQCVLLVVSEARDLGEVDRFSFYEHCKTYLATPPEWINCDEKHIKEQKVANVMGVVFTTNHRTSGIHLPPDDRRHFVAWSNLTREAFPPDYFTRLYRWYAQGGLDHVAAYLRGLDIRHFDPKAEPEKTEAWHAIVSADVSPGESELADALDALGVPVAITMDQIRRAAETQQLIELCTTLNDGRSARRVPHMMESVGYTQVRNQAAKDGKWKVGGKKRHIYGLRTKTYSEHYQAIMCFPLLTETRIR